MPTPFDTIVAEATPPGIGGLSVVRLSGPEAWAIASVVFLAWPATPSNHRARYGRFVHGDDGLALPFEEGHGYTGESAVEFSIHGSPASVASLIAACLEAGARRAEPGEFTQRAFLNGRLDLTEAEGVLATAESETEAQLSAANALRGGSLSAAVGEVRATLVEVLAEIEARVDFAEEVGPLDREAAVKGLETAYDRLESLLRSAAGTRIVRRGLRVAIVGRPNAGKSSLLNAMLNHERAIVTAIPGTTRDVIEERLDVRGYPVVLIDTAGLREAQDPVEALGVQRSRLAASDADTLWYVYDSSVGWIDEDASFVQSLKDGDRDILVVANKCDAISGTAKEGEIAVSALTREGLGKLVDRLISLFETTRLATPVNERHAELLAKAAEAVNVARETIEHDRPEDLASVTIADALDYLGRVTGETSTPDMLHEVFARFCIGK